MKRLKLGVFGGTFNPIHLGHLMIAEEAYQSFQLEKVLFIPSYMTPNKDVPGATAAQRFEMVRLATEDNPHFVVSDMEIRRGGNSYTLDTLQLLKNTYGDQYDLYFISGTDAIQDLPNWHEPEAILNLCHVIAASRPDGTETITPVVQRFGSLGKHIVKMEVPTMKISSTELRKRIVKGGSVRYMMPPAVLDYIRKNGIYT